MEGLAYLLQAAVLLAGKTLRVPCVESIGTLLLGTKRKSPAKRSFFKWIGAQEGTRTPTMLLAST